MKLGDRLLLVIAVHIALFAIILGCLTYILRDYEPSIYSSAVDGNHSMVGYCAQFQRRHEIPIINCVYFNVELVKSRFEFNMQYKWVW
jgi:hypothetical protein